MIDNQLEAKFDTGAIEHTLLAGLDYTKLRFRALDGRGVSPPLDTKNPTQGRPVDAIDFNTRTVQDQWQVGTYLQDQIRYDAWTLTVGGRYDWVSTDTDTTDLTTETLTSVSQKDKEFSGRVGLTYQTDFGLAPYISYSTAFTPNAGLNQETKQPFKPTESEQQEIGVKYLLPNSNTLITAALFNIDQKMAFILKRTASPTFRFSAVSCGREGSRSKRTPALTTVFPYRFLRLYRREDHSGPRRHDWQLCLFRTTAHGIHLGPLYTSGRWPFFRS
ncbi:hypothetical protein T190_20295 [Sinorhizobium meliloti CCBAU 01290]|nr:hypothetical protein T190_20295 [Sinorhizobium meliloti CCBAU 01290]